MWLLYVGLALFVAKMLDLGPLGELSWFWVVLPFVLAFLWWEFVERRLGFDKRKAFDELDKAKKERIARSLERDKAGERMRRR